MVKYFFRLDDIAPNMNWGNFNRIRKIFERYEIKPLIAVIPDVQDPKLLNWPIDKNFWNIAKELLNEGWIIGQHGYRHLSGGDGGFLRIHGSGEFGGLDFDDQKSIIAAGREIIKEKLADPKIFVAPRHSFDKNTMEVLKINNFDYISDGIGLYPFKKWGLVWLPQILWRPRKGLFGMVTIALHANTMNLEEINKLEKFIKENRNKVGNFFELMEWYKQTSAPIKIITHIINQAFKIIWWPIFWTKFRISK